MEYSLPVSSIHGIFQAIVLEWVAISYSRGSSWPRYQTQVPRIAGRRFTIYATREALSRKTILEILKSILEMSAHFPSSGPHPLWVRNHRREGECSSAIWSWLNLQPLWVLVYLSNKMIGLKTFLSRHKGDLKSFLGGSVVKNLPAMQETRVQSLGWEDPL